MELYFEKDDFDSFIIRLEQRSDIQYIGDGVKEAGWGQRCIRFYDLDGHIIEVGESMRMVVKLNGGDHQRPVRQCAGCLES